MRKSGTKISLGKDGFSFETDGLASQRLANAVLDFLSPITGSAGLLGTKLRGFQMEAALESTLKAKRICEEHDLPINPVPPKFLLQWVEGASLEDIGSDEDLSDLWANLLVTTSSKDDDSSKLFIDILKKISSKHAKLLKSLIQNKTTHHWVDVADQVRPRNLRRTLKNIPMEEIPPHHAISPENVPAFIKKHVNPVVNSSGCALITGDVRSPDNFVPRTRELVECLHEKFHEYDDSLNAIYDLKGLNLVEIYEITGFELLGLVLELEYVSLTEFGIQFLLACMPDEVSIKYGVKKS